MRDALELKYKQWSKVEDNCLDLLKICFSDPEKSDEEVKNARKQLAAISAEVEKLSQENNTLLTFII